MRSGAESPREAERAKANRVKMKIMVVRKIIISLAVLLSAGGFRGAEAQVRPPRLVVNIVVSQMRYDYLERFNANFGTGGFRRFEIDGMSFPRSYYDYMQTTTPVTLSTLATGADPAVHGVVGERWTDYVAGRRIRLIEDTGVRGIECDAGVGQYSPAHLFAPTLSEAVEGSASAGRAVTIAADPMSAIVLGGHSKEVYWLDPTRCTWVSSSAYMDALPGWVSRYNATKPGMQFLGYHWVPSLAGGRSYVNSRATAVDTSGSRSRSSASGRGKDYAGVLRTPAGNTLVAEFAKQAVTFAELGRDEKTDLLNICFDTPRYVGELYGGESMETEDMFYRLDQEIADLLNYIFAVVPEREVVVVLTSDHGASDSFDAAVPNRERFNADQFRVIVNGYLSAQYGQDNWILDFTDRQIYLDRDLIAARGLSLEEVRNRVADFALRFRGVSHALTHTAMTGSYFGSSYGLKMQNGFFPKRSGDVTINLMAGWIVEQEGLRSQSGSMYDYDTHVPLMFLGGGIPAGTVREPVDMTAVAPTLAYIMHIERPAAATAQPIDAVERALGGRPDGTERK